MNILERFEELTNLISASCIAFKADAEQIYKDRDARIQEIKETFKQTSPQYQASIEQAKEQAEKQLMQARVDYSKDVLQMATEIEDAETTAMWKVNRDKLADIKAISDLPLTVAEISAMNDKYGSDYWCNRALSNIAEKNGIDISEIGIEPSFDVKMDVLHQCTNSFCTFLTDYQPRTGSRPRTTEELKIDVAVSNEVMQRANLLYSGKINELSNDEIVSKSLLNLKSQRTEMEVGVSLGNILRNTKSKVDVRNRLLCEVSQDANISSLSVELSGFADEINSFKNGRATKYRQAEAVISSMMDADKDFIMQRIEENKDNEFFAGMMNNEAKKNSTIKEAWGEYVKNNATQEQATESGIAE